MQCVAVQKKLGDETFEILKGLTQESSLTITGKLRADQRAPGGFELDIEEFVVLQRVPETDPYPITPKNHGTEFLLDHRHLWLRSARQSAILRIRSTVIEAAQMHLSREGFTLINAPVLSKLTWAGNDTASESVEGNGAFEGEFFSGESAQPYNEAAAMALGKVYSFGPIFSAEPNKTRRDLAELWLIEPEMPFATLQDVERLARKLVDQIVDAVIRFRPEELKALERDAGKLGESWGKDIPPITYDDAVTQLRGAGSQTLWGQTFSVMDQQLLTLELTVPLMVEQLPQSAIPSQFLKADGQRPDATSGFILLAPEGYGEIISGGERFFDYAQLMEHLPANSPHSGWYADLRKYGTVPHAGFAMCIEHVVAWICGLEHVRETSAFPRLEGRVTP